MHSSLLVEVVKNLGYAGRARILGSVVFERHDLGIEGRVRADLVVSLAFGAGAYDEDMGWKMDEATNEETRTPCPACYSEEKKKAYT